MINERDIELIFYNLLKYPNKYVAFRNEDIEVISEDGQANTETQSIKLANENNNRRNARLPQLPNTTKSDGKRLVATYRNY